MVATKVRTNKNSKRTHDGWCYMVDGEWDFDTLSTSRDGAREIFYDVLGRERTNDTRLHKIALKIVK